ncbi:MAG: cell division protein FtsA [Holosporaceae bacterium]|jgi:cell division protein FtsA|nr:cell division protein FtsA [Holosporaceae bacterium]
MIGRNVVTVLDIGSSKVCCCIASVSGDGRFSILGTGCCVCLGVKSGIIVDMASVERSVAAAVERAEKSANYLAKSVYVNISGASIKSRIVNASIYLGGKIIKNDDIVRLLSSFDEHMQEMDLIHSIPIMYSVDSLNGVKDPVGMIAQQISASICIVGAPKQQLRNIVLCLSRCHLEPVGIVASGYASGLCVIGESQNNGNQIVVDIGDSTASASFFFNDTFCGMETIPLGGRSITKDIALGLNISFASAERLKTLHGAAFVSIDDDRDMIFIPAVEENNVIDLQQIPKSALNHIIQYRVEEILKILKKKIDESIFHNDFSKSGVTLTGGGSNLTGIKDFAMGILNRKVNLKKINCESSEQNILIDNGFSVALGMIKFAQLSEISIMVDKPKKKMKNSANFFRKTLNWIENNL